MAVEDAFIARLGPDEKRFGLLGIITDPVGIYYDAHRPSLVEELITESADSEPVADTPALMRMLVRHALGKFNRFEGFTAPEQINDEAFDAIVVDQIAGDLSIEGALASGVDFERMLEAAFDENPGGRVAVKQHPYDGVGGRQGHLRAAAQRYGAEILSTTAPWIRYAQNANRVYIVSSNAGLEALLAGAQVTCFGVPFFGGWGLTDDRQSCDRRTASPTLEQLCQAVYGAYGQYWNPGQNRPGTALALARSIVAHQRHHHLLGNGLALHGVPKLKRSHIAPFLPRGAPLNVKKSPARTSTTSGPTGVWASRLLKSQDAQASWEGHPRLHVEDGFIRSAGLGADLIRPSSLVFDRRGIYFDPSTTSDLEHALEHDDLDEEQLQRGAELIERLKTTRISKYNVGQTEDLRATSSKRVILVPGQVANDASVLRGGGTIRSNEQLLEAVRASNPDAFVIYKPHPDVEVAGRPGFVPHADRLADQVLTGASALSAIEACDEIHTLTSLLGFEALLRDKAVTTYGQPFYAGWGLTNDRAPVARRTRKRTLAQLAYITLIAYPLYVSPTTNEPCTPEDVIEALASGLNSKPSIPLGRSTLRLLRKLKTFGDYLR
ncbi:MAG: capsular polysaccharide biosynthesis protein [Parvularculaceae bacterium]|nr:capsular polysaccharide biosynthesis protein [Parvularculaceae bacterium]